MPMDDMNASGDQVGQPFLASFASAFKFQPVQEDRAEGTSGKAKTSGTKGTSQWDPVLNGVGFKRGKGRKRVERTGGGEWGKSKERLKIARVESDVRKVMDRLISRVEGLVGAEVKKLVRCEARKRRQEERQKKANDRAAAKEAKEIRKLTRPSKHLSPDSKGTKNKGNALPKSSEKYAEDQLLPGANRLPPASRPVGNGFFADEDMAGIVEVWAFLNRFGVGLGLSEIPDLYQIEQGLSNPKEYPAQASTLIHIHSQLVNLLLQEAYRAAKEALRNSGGSANGKASLEGCPQVNPKCWEEGFRRYLVALKTADSATQYFSRVSSCSLPQKMDLPCRLSILQPRVCLAILCGGINRRLDHISPLFLAPARNTKAFNCMLNLDDAQGMATVEQWLNGQSPFCCTSEMNTSDLRTRLDLRKALRSIIHAKDPRSGAPGELICYHGASSAPLVQSPFQWDLHRVASLAQAGAYVGEEPLKLMLSDVVSGCNILESAIALNPNCLVRDLRNLGAKASRAVKRVSAKLQEHTLRESAGHARDSNIQRPFMPFEGCCICWKDDDNPRILLCDNCDDEYHVYCLNPPLEEIPQGDWFCPACAQNNSQQQSPHSVHQGMKSHATRDFCNEQLMQVLQQKPYVSMSLSERVSIFLKICECALETNKLRSLLESSIDAHKEMQRELAILLAKKNSRRTPTPPSEDHMSENPLDSSPVDEEIRSRARIQEMKQKMSSCSLRPTVLGWDRHFNCYWAFGGKQSSGIFIEKSTRECWMSTESHLRNSFDRVGPSSDDASQNPSKSKKSTKSHVKNVSGQHNVTSGSHFQQLACCSQTQNEDVKLAGAHAWHIQTSRSELQSLIDFLNPLGEREHALKAALEAFCTESELLDAKNVTHPESSQGEDGCHSDMPDKHFSEPFGYHTIVAEEDTRNEVAPDPGLASASNIREELTQLMDRLSEDSFEEVRGSSTRRTKWRNQMKIASTPKELMCGLMSLLSMLRPSKLKPHWLLWGFPTQDPAAVSTFSAVFYHLQAATSALRLQGKQPRLVLVSKKSAPCVNDSSGGVRRSVRVAQLASIPKDATSWTATSEVSKSEEDWDNEDLSDVELRIASRSQGQCAKAIVDETSSDEELVDTDSDYDTDQEELGQRTAGTSDELMAKRLHYQLNSNWRSGKT